MTTRPEPTGTGRQTDWFKWVHRKVERELQIIPGPGILIERTPNGVVVKVDPKAIGGSNAGEARWG